MLYLKKILVFCFALTIVGVLFLFHSCRKGESESYKVMLAGCQFRNIAEQISQADTDEELGLPSRWVLAIDRQLVEHNCIDSILVKDGRLYDVTNTEILLIKTFNQEFELIRDIRNGGLELSSNSMFIYTKENISFYSSKTKEETISTLDAHFKNSN